MMRGWLIGLTVVTMAFCFPTGDAEAQLRAGTYKITGGKDGKTKKRYSGVVDVVRTGRTFGVHRWTSRGVTSGVAVVHKSIVWVGAGTGAAALLMHRDARGGVRGFFGAGAGAGQVWSFTGTGPAGPDFEGTYKLRGTTGAGTRFVGVLEFESSNFIDRVVLRANGRTWTGLASGEAGTVRAGFGTDVWTYEIKGRKLEGANAAGDHPSKFDEEVLTPVTVGPVKRLQAIAKATCRCRKGVCAEAALHEFGRFYRAFKTLKVSQSSYGKIKSLSVKTTRCLMKRGISGQRVMALVSGGSGGATPATPEGFRGTIHQLAKSTCRCKTRPCGDRSLAQFGAFIRANKHKKVGRREAKRVGESSKRITQCLMSVGIAPGQIMKLLK